MIRVATHEHVHTLSPDAAPVMTARANETICLEILDGLEGRALDASEGRYAPGPSDVNPATGPVFIEGVRAGDALRVTIDAVTCADEGYIGLWLPRIGVQVPKSAHMRVPIREGCALLDGMPFPLRPMIGVIGVAHPSGYDTRCAGDAGGNLDTPGIEPGAVLFLPAFVDGGLLCAGDLHAMQGDGEVFGQGIETSGTVTLRARAQKGLTLMRPLLLTRDGRMETIASHEQIEQAAELAVADMGDILGQCGLTPARRALLIAARGDLRICQMVNPQRTVRMSLSVAECEAYGADLSGILY